MSIRDSISQRTTLVLLAMSGPCAFAGSGVGAAVTETNTAASSAAFDQCFEHHARRYGLDAELLRGVARVESGMRPRVSNDTHIARTGTRDLGLMQINTSLLPKLASYGITEQDLMDPCTNIEVGAWVLSDTLRRHGNSWQAVGAYNAACTQLKGQACTDARSRYAWAVYRRMDAAPALQAAADAKAPLAATANVRGSGLINVADEQRAALEARQ